MSRDRPGVPPALVVIDALLDPELPERIEAAAEEAGEGLRELRRRQATREEDRLIRQAVSRTETPPEHLTAEELHQLMESTEIPAAEACRVAWHLLGDCTRCREALGRAVEIPAQAVESTDPVLRALRLTRPEYASRLSEAERLAVHQLFDEHPTAFARLVLEVAVRHGFASPGVLPELARAFLPIAEAARHRLPTADLVDLRGLWHLTLAQLLAGYDPEAAVREAMEAASHLAVGTEDPEGLGISPQLERRIGSSGLSDPLRDLFRPVAQRWLLTLRKLLAVLTEMSPEELATAEVRHPPSGRPSEPPPSSLGDLPPKWVAHQESSTSVLREFDFASFEEAAGYLQSLKDLLSSPEAPEFEVSIQGGSLILRITVTDPEQASQFIHLLASQGESSAQG